MSIIPKEVFERWENALCENLVLATSKKFYCSFKDCSTMLVNDDGNEVVTCSECPNCHRLFCAQGKVAWHGGMECGEFMGLNENEREKEDLMVMNLAKANKRWRRCSKCRIYVEKKSGMFTHFLQVWPSLLLCLWKAMESVSNSSSDERTRSHAQVGIRNNSNGKNEREDSPDSQSQAWGPVPNKLQKPNPTMDQSSSEATMRKARVSVCAPSEAPMVSPSSLYGSTN
ncbi:hypothetical protein S83_037896 [Arachis hypogaea]